MKTHAEQRAHEAQTDGYMRSIGVTRVDAPCCEAFLRAPGDFVAVLAVRRDRGEQHNYAMILEAGEVDLMGLGEQDGWRELLPECQRKEEDVRRKREASVDYLAHKLAAAMLDYLEKKDPQFGYAPKEWRGMKP